ncbi:MULTISPECIES: class I SAM-dependent methyltransferase [unclassified Leifsonia]|uniref:class I SAM-dependent methyltransferase n=1 Tax=unclassified Leifsonia TaxID=2663824 RepID=UPI0006F60BE5|nr:MULTISPECIES: class I SAM-dependent methyltransferase [unclassified Leifsonia]KQX08210.1 SAM-dependent methyltransferase [Leifsonia sp. Root1293]KRA12492.1 SAM-dependent methyltransferase [Leifsonia sp. Root60]
MTDNDVDALGERLLTAGLGMTQMLSIHIGDRLGWYRALADGAARTSTELAAATSTDERYAREWLEQQAVFGLLEATDAADGPPDPAARAAARTFRMSSAAAEVLTDEHSLTYLAPFARSLTAAALRMPELLEAYRSGGGVGWAAYGDDMREAQADMNRPWFESRLADALRTIPELRAALERPGARIAEIGFGGGHASIALALGFQDAAIEGFDVDEASVTLARRNAEEAGVADRIEFHLANGSELAGTFDVVFAFECVHDMPQPVPVLAAARAALAPGGVMIVVDEAVADEFSAPGDETEQLMYGFSLLVCLPDGRSHTPSEATGTVMRRSTLESYAHRAGYASVDVLPIEGFAAFRFYALRP